MSRPNIFKIATKELSHDAFITWLLQWADPRCEEQDLEMYNSGRCFLGLFLTDEEKKKQVMKIEADRQWNHIDIWACINFHDGDRLLIIIENKIFTGEHSNQLVRYREFAENWANDEGYRLACFYTKIGNQSSRFINEIETKGYKVIDRVAIMNCIKSTNTKNTVILDYLDFLRGWEEEFRQFETKLMCEWNGWQWQGFFCFIEKQIDIVQWHFVNNPSGGFWNLCLNWDYWHVVPIYMQLEQDKLCFKIALGEDETGLDHHQTDLNVIQDFSHHQLIIFAKEKGFTQIRKPRRHVHSGNYRTFATVFREDWLGKLDTLVEKEQVMARLLPLIEFYKEFMRRLNMISFETASIKYCLLPETTTAALPVA